MIHLWENLYDCVAEYLFHRGTNINCVYLRVGAFLCHVINDTKENIVKLRIIIYLTCPSYVFQV